MGGFVSFFFLLGAGSGMVGIGHICRVDNPDRGSMLGWVPSCSKKEYFLTTTGDRVIFLLCSRKFFSGYISFSPLLVNWPTLNLI